MDQERITQVCYEANRSICERSGDQSQEFWHEASDEQKKSVRKFVAEMILRGTNPQLMHHKWYLGMRHAGWVYDVKECDKAKTHPDMRSYGDLPELRRLKDGVMAAIVCSMEYM